MTARTKAAALVTAWIVYGVIGIRYAVGPTKVTPLFEKYRKGIIQLTAQAALRVAGAPIPS